MTVALLLGAVLVALIGLPLAAVAWSRAPHLRRPSVATWTDLLYAEARRVGLSAEQITAVTRAVNTGAVAPVDLRALTAKTATAKAAWLTSALYPFRGGRRFAIMAALIVVGGGVAVACIVGGRPAAVVPTGVVEGVVIFLAFRLIWGSQLRRAQRAARLNGVTERDDGAAASVLLD